MSVDISLMDINLKIKTVIHIRRSEFKYYDLTCGIKKKFVHFLEELQLKTLMLWLHHIAVVVSTTTN